MFAGLMAAVAFVPFERNHPIHMVHQDEVQHL
jgi:hypothetical protein